MASSSWFDDEPTCAVLGCTETAAKEIRHPDHGRRVVCPDHVLDYEVIGDA